MSTSPDAFVRLSHPLHVGQFVRRRRRALALRQHDLAAAAGVQYIWISKLENGHDGLDFSRVLRTLAALDIDLGLIARPGRPAWMEGFVRQRIPREPPKPKIPEPKTPDPEAARKPRRRPRRWAVRALPGAAKPVGRRAGMPARDTGADKPRVRRPRRKERPIYDR